MSTFSRLLGHDERYEPHFWIVQTLSRLTPLLEGYDFASTTRLTHALLLMACIRTSSMMNFSAKYGMEDLASSHQNPATEQAAIEPEAGHPLLTPSCHVLGASSVFFWGFEGSPLSGEKGKAVMVKAATIHEDATIAEPIIEGIPAGGVYARSLSLLPHEIFPPVAFTAQFSGTSFEGTQVLSPTSPLDTVISPNHEGDSGSPCSEYAMDFEKEGNDMYLELEDLNEPMVSTESSKKLKIEDGDECSSHLFN
ncbi:hypothetical protein Cgig2_003708 [Carnegiea gigantea]|uniref:Uncharacterized protein n=1 Tax=Carnegiea gigantea TaxID=171969 RepID=A0A9Q1QI45_9CARY|nr:hypothetical protein Cgig2_003708 [Carnegiea gigantea]